jgi:hypothetical protein
MENGQMIEAVRILAEIAGFILIVFGGGKFNVAINLLNTLINAIESTQASHVKKTVNITVKESERAFLNTMLQDKGLLGKSDENK